MTDFENELKSRIGELLEAERSRPGAHPKLAEIASYHEGKLTAAEETRLQDHLVSCSECLRLLLDLEEISKADFGAERPISEFELTAAWHGFRARIRQELARRVYAMAASLLVAVVALSLWIALQHRTIADLSQPQLNAPVLDLYPQTAVRRGESPPPVLAIPRTARFFTLVLSPAGSPDFTDYEVEILRVSLKRAKAEVIWQGAGLKKNSFGSFSLTLPQQLIPAGDYRIRLIGRSAGRRQPIEDYAVRVEYR